MPIVTGFHSPRRISATLGSGFRASANFTHGQHKRADLFCSRRTNEAISRNSRNMNEIIKFKLNGAWISAPDDWLDATNDLPKKVRHSKERIVLQKEDGIGTINISVLRWKYRIQLDYLRGMLLEMCESFSGEKPFNYFERKRPLMISAASVEDDNGAFTRFWYCSDGRMIALIAYTSDEEPHIAEMNECEKIVEDLYFGEEDEEDQEEPGKQDENSLGLN